MWLVNINMDCMDQKMLGLWSQEVNREEEEYRFIAAKIIWLTISGRAWIRYG